MELPYQGIVKGEKNQEKKFPCIISWLTRMVHEYIHVPFFALDIDKICKINNFICILLYKILFVANLENQLMVFSFSPFISLKKKISMENTHKHIFFQSSKSIGLSVYFNSRNVISGPTGTHNTQETWEMQTLGFHTRPIKGVF